MIHIKSYPGCKSRMLASQTLYLTNRKTNLQSELRSFLSQNRQTKLTPIVQVSSLNHNTLRFAQNFFWTSALSISSSSFRLCSETSRASTQRQGSAVRQAAHLLNVLGFGFIQNRNLHILLGKFLFPILLSDRLPWAGAFCSCHLKNFGNFCDRFLLVVLIFLRAIIAKNLFGKVKNLYGKVKNLNGKVKN